jgi:hypothetical protein
MALFSIEHLLAGSPPPAAADIATDGSTTS